MKSSDFDLPPVAALTLRLLISPWSAVSPRWFFPIPSRKG